MLPPKKNRPAKQQTLLKLYSSLDLPGQTTLLEFAEFLAGKRAAAEPDTEQGPAEPRPIPRPDKETVIGAIKRLSGTYYMLDRSDLLTESSSLMSAHMMHGRKAPEVIDDLEAIFSSYYATHVSDKEKLLVGKEK